MNRSSGILLPVSALPGPCGIGDLGADARDFIDFLLLFFRQRIEMHAAYKGQYLLSGE